MDLHVSLTGRRDLYGQIYRQVRDAILEGALRPGDRLPPTRELARGLSVSRATVTAAYERLSGEGFLAPQVGAGTFVSQDTSFLPRGLRSGRPQSQLRPRRIWEETPLPDAFAGPAQFDFRTGLPDASLFPFGVWRRLVAAEMRRTAIGKGVYGDPAGHRGLREAIARHIAVSRGVLASSDDVVITNGTQQALDVLARVLLEPGDRVAVEDPGYSPPRWLFKSLGAQVLGVPVDGEGIVVEALHPRTKVVYVTPSHQYPLGMAMSFSRRVSLIDWVARHDAAIIEDDYDSEFRLYGRPVEPLQTLDPAGRVVYVGSFSKTMLPTMRLGFLVATPSLRRAIQAAKFVTDWHTPLPFQAALARFIDEGGFARHLGRMKAIYRSRHALVRDILEREFAGMVEVVPAIAGLHISAITPHHSSDQIRDIVRRAGRLGVAIHPLSWFTFDVEGPAGLMFGYGAIDQTRIPEGLSRLRACFQAP